MRTTRSVLMVAVLAATSPAMAQEAGRTEAETPRVANGQQFGAWTVTCEAIAVGETACVLTQRLVRTQDNAFLAELLAFTSGDGSGTFIAARVPNGVYFPSGFAFKPEDADKRYEFTWQSCTRDLCEALLEIEPDDLAALASAETGVIAGYRPSLAVDPLVFRFSLAGAEEGLSALSQTVE